MCPPFSVNHKPKEEGRRKKEEGRRKKEEGRRKKEGGRRKKEESFSYLGESETGFFTKKQDYNL
ncbi:hypothetical protein QUB08_14375 [Microcoleus sp. BR0-C5]|uniref:hypothetical protein n=1 Tax=Microcoleus sp. BR0-C5 TaxID=2818713 RepID=UPI002FD10639